MPIEKFRSFAEAEEALWCKLPDAAYYQRLRRFWRGVAKLSSQRLYPHGITRYKSASEAASKMDEWLFSQVESQDK